MNTVIDT